MKTQSAMQDLTGTTIRGYHLGESIGRGGLGIVHRARQTAVNRDVVIKAILPQYAHHPEFIRNFEAEAQLIARLEHIHIVPLYDYWRGPEGAFLVMRWLRGGNLRESLTTQWSLEAILKLTAQITSALALAHRNHIIHQDIKPANILFDEDGNAFLTDFGLARDLTNSLDLSVTDNDNVRGSPAYISPEQIQRQKVSPQTDIYSLGIVLYEMLSGGHPFITKSVVQQLQHQLDTALPSLHAVRPDLPPEIDTVLWRATTKEPEYRYDDAVSFGEAIYAVLAPLTGHLPTPSSDSAELAPETITEVIDISTIKNLIPASNPYKGLKAFEAADAADFFGREAIINHLVQQLQDQTPNHRFLAVVGPSGSGKSSVVKAGLLPLLQQGLIAESYNWYIVTMKPGIDPTTELAQALMNIAPSDTSDINTHLQQPNGLHLALTTLLPDPQRELMLIIDQFEEIFTLSNDEAARQHFLAMLYHALTTSGSRLRLVITLRADFYDRPLLYPGFGDLIRTRTEVILPMSHKELNSAITAPAERAGLTVEPGLAETIINDVQHQPNSLPLLQFTLTELYEQRKNKMLTLAAYARIGGVTGALSRRAEEVYMRFDTSKQALIEQIFLRLIVSGNAAQNTRYRAVQHEITALDPQAAPAVLETFAQYRLLSFDRDPETRQPTVEIAHEALITTWDRLRQWLDDNRERLQIQRQLSTAAQDWQNHQHDRSFLATGARLERFSQITNSLALNDLERDYLTTSQKRQYRNQNIRNGGIIVLTAITLLFIALSGVALWQRGIALQERQRANTQAQISRSRELAAAALTTQTQVDLPLLLSMEALATSDTFEARNSLLTTLQQQPTLLNFMHGHTDSVRALATSGPLLASGGKDTTIRLWDVETTQPIGQPLIGHTDWINTLIFSENGQKIISGAEDGQIIVWDLSDPPTQQRIIDSEQSAIWSLSLTPDNRTLFSGGADNTIKLWDLSTGQQITTLHQQQGIIYALALSPDGQRLASGSADGTIVIYDTQTLEPLHQINAHDNWVFTLSYSTDGRYLASGSADGSVRLWDSQTGSPTIPPLRVHTGWVRRVQFTPDQQQLISSDQDGTVIVWDYANQQPTFALKTPNNEGVWDFALTAHKTIVVASTASSLTHWDFSSDTTLSKVIAQQDNDLQILAADSTQTLFAQTQASNEIILHDITQQQSVATLQGHTSTVLDVAFSPSGQWIASSSLDQTVIIWDRTTRQKVTQLSVSEPIFALAFNSNGTQLALGGNAGTITLWDTSATDPDAWQQAQQLNGHQDRVIALVYHPVKSWLISGSRDATLRLWDTAEAVAIGEPATAHNGGILSVTLNATGDLAASGSRDMSVRLWSVTQNGLIMAGNPYTGHTNWVTDVAFSADGAILASASGDHTVRLWDTIENQPLGQPLNGHRDWVNNLVYTTDALYSAGRDGQLIRWQAGITAWQYTACQITGRTFTENESQRYLQGQTALTHCES